MCWYLTLGSLDFFGGVLGVKRAAIDGVGYYVECSGGQGCCFFEGCRVGIEWGE
jgi:hypothetical protein